LLGRAKALFMGLFVLACFYTFKMELTYSLSSKRLIPELQKFITLYGNNQLDTKVILAKEVLAEIPDQLVEQMRKISRQVTSV